MTCFLLIRHGATDHTGRVLSGRDEIALNQIGQDEAASLPERLAALPPDVLCSSPLARCQQTAAPLAETFGLTVQKLSALQELDYGQWQGQAWGDLEDDALWQRYNQYRSLCRIPDGELMLEAQLRMLQALETLGRESLGATVAVVSHADPIRAVLAYCLGMPLDMIHRLVVTTGSISAITLGGADVRVHCINHRSTLSKRDLFP